MNLVRWKNGPDRLDLDKVFDQFFDAPFHSTFGAERGDWIEPVTIRDEGGKIVIRTECPGLRAEDIRIDLDGGYLTLQGERNARDTDERGGFRKERFFQGVMRHSLKLPENTDSKNIRAEFKEGMLIVQVPKRDGRSGRKISIEGTSGETGGSFLIKIKEFFRNFRKGLVNPFSAIKRSLLTQTK